MASEELLWTGSELTWKIEPNECLLMVNYVNIIIIIMECPREVF